MRIFLFIAVAALAWGQLSIPVFVGFGIPAAGQHLATVNETAVYHTYGRALYFGAGVDYEFASNLDAGLLLQVLLQPPVSYRAGDEEVIFRASMLQLFPNVRIKADAGGIRPYARFGMMLGIAPKAIEEFYEYGDPTVKTVSTYRKGAAVGVGAGAGVEFSLGGINLFAELLPQTIIYKPKELEVDVNGLRFIYVLVDSGTGGGRRLAPKLPFSALLFKIGASFGGM